MGKDCGRDGVVVSVPLTDCDRPFSELARPV